MLPEKLYLEHTLAKYHMPEKSIKIMQKVTDAEGNKIFEKQPTIRRRSLQRILFMAKLGLE